MRRAPHTKPENFPTPRKVATRHPAVVALDEFRRGNPQMFADSAAGRYLDHQLDAAFQAGWDAAVRAVYQALEARS
jgi:hypothetical protein